MATSTGRRKKRREPVIVLLGDGEDEVASETDRERREDLSSVELIRRLLL